MPVWEQSNILMQALSFAISSVLLPILLYPKFGKGHRLNFSQLAPQHRLKIPPKLNFPFLEHVWSWQWKEVNWCFLLLARVPLCERRSSSFFWRGMESSRSPQGGTFPLENLFTSSSSWHPDIIQRTSVDFCSLKLHYLCDFFCGWNPQWEVG